MASASITVLKYTGTVCANAHRRASPRPMRVLCGSSNEVGIKAWKEVVCEPEDRKRDGKATLDLCSEPSLGEPRATAVFALATPKSPIDRGGRWQLQLY
jgi:hypothetical protein